MKKQTIQILNILIDITFILSIFMENYLFAIIALLMNIRNDLYYYTRLKKEND